MEALMKGRRKQGVERQLRVRIPAEDYSKLEALAQFDNTNVSEVVRRVLRTVLTSTFSRVE